MADGKNNEILVTADEILRNLRDICETNMANDEQLISFTKYMWNPDEYKNTWADRLCAEGGSIVRNCNSLRLYYYFMSFLLHTTHNFELYKEILRKCINDDRLTKENKYFLYVQFLSFDFLSQEKFDDEIKDLQDDLYNDIYIAYKKEVDSGFQFIPRYERNPDFIMILSSQVLYLPKHPEMLLHGPTKIVFDFCEMFEKKLNKHVYIVNTAETLTTYQEIPFFEQRTANYIEELGSLDSLDYHGKSYSYFQCPKEMPDVNIIREILNVVMTEKPYFILTVGGDSIVSDLCSNIVPTVTSSLSASRTMTYGQFQMITGGNITDYDRAWMNKHSLPPEHIINMKGAYTFYEPLKHLTRYELGFPEDRFVAVLVGTRLDNEIDSEFIKLLYDLIEEDIYIAFVGKFDDYCKYSDSDKIFNNMNSCILGFRDDLLSIYECCDIYLNPKRSGGGTSAAQALYMGLPVVTMDFGDIGTVAGDDFYVSDYGEMFTKVLQYRNDCKYYELMRKKSKLRAKDLESNENEFVELINMLEASDRF